jgi:hypothetical protein
MNSACNVCRNAVNAAGGGGVVTGPNVGGGEFGDTKPEELLRAPRLPAATGSGRP